MSGSKPETMTPSVESGLAATVVRKHTSKQIIDSLERENFDLVAKVIYLINERPGWSEDDTFTFPDGDTWHKFEPEGDKKCLTK
jgi:hypothetical protein